jgi:hypothetical protein
MFTQEERITYNLNYKFELKDRTVYLDEESFSKNNGYCFIEYKNKNYSYGSQGGKCNEVETKIMLKDFEKGNFVKSIELEVDYE